MTLYHHTKNKGDLGVLKAQVDLHQKGYLILIPHTEQSPFDLVVYKDGYFKRVAGNQISFIILQHKRYSHISCRQKRY